VGRSYKIELCGACGMNATRGQTEKKKYSTVLECEREVGGREGDENDNVARGSRLVASHELLQMSRYGATG
jgi:hypothetical protein